MLQENVFPTQRAAMKEVQYDYSKDFTSFESVNYGIGHYGQSVYSFEDESGVYMTPTVVDYVNRKGVRYASHKLKIPGHLGERVAKSQIYCTKLHPCCLELKEGYTTVNSNEYTLHMIYEYCEGASLFSEQIPINHVIIQLLCCIKAVHLKKLTFGGCLHPYKMFYCKNGLVKIGGIGIGSVLFDDSISVMQNNDILQFGYMLLQVMTRSIPFLEATPELLEQVKEPWIKTLIHSCITNSYGDIDKLLALAYPFMYNSINLHALNLDLQKTQLSKQSENGRISNLLIKLGFINERTNYSNNPDWSDIGGNYLLKLFRDFVFHQVDEDGKPVLDIYHCVYHLNKVLDILI
eukprot:NODE_149_length_17312_cov_0.399349.p6 type:complete len:349 gc:universal NODE_149_length_17312_cov_0.399349:8763-7717(-)